MNVTLPSISSDPSVMFKVRNFVTKLQVILYSQMINFINSPIYSAIQKTSVIIYVNQVLVVWTVFLRVLSGPPA